MLHFLPVDQFCLNILMKQGFRFFPFLSSFFLTVSLSLRWLLLVPWLGFNSCRVNKNLQEISIKDMHQNLQFSVLPGLQCLFHSRQIPLQSRNPNTMIFFRIPVLEDSADCFRWCLISSTTQDDPWCNFWSGITCCRRCTPFPSADLAHVLTLFIESVNP